MAFILLVRSGSPSEHGSAINQAESFRRAWTDYTATRDSVPGLQKAAWALIRVTFTRGGLVVLLCLAAVGWAAVGGER